MVRLSNLLITWKLMRVGKFALIVPVITSTDGALGRHDDVDAGGTRHLRQALHCGLNLLAGDHHQVGHLVDHDDDIGQVLMRLRLHLIGRFAGLAVETGLHAAFCGLALGRHLGHALVIAADVADAELAHVAVPALHLARGPFQRGDGLSGFGDDRGQQMRDALIDRQLQHFGVDHDQAALIGRHPEQDRQDHGVDADRLARTGRASDQQMRHPRQVGDHRGPADVLAKRQRQPAGVAAPVLAAEQL